MNGNNTNNSLMCNPNQILKSLPLKKRRTYLVDSPILNDEENDSYSQTMKQPYPQGDSFQKHISPSAPHIELLHQRYACSLANSINIHQQNYLRPFTYDCLMMQRFLDNYRLLNEQEKRSGSAVEDITVDEHFRKSLGDNYSKFIDRYLTPEDSSPSSTDQTSVDSIEEHFARSLVKFSSLNPDEVSSINRRITESFVDDHFAKALGSTTWEKLKEKS